MSNELARKDTRPLTVRTAERFGVDADKMATTMKATCFRQRGRDDKPAPEVSNEQLMALLIVSEQYNLNPFTKEIFAFPDGAGIVPMISVDGWIRIINERETFDGYEFAEGPILSEGPFRGLPEWMDCTIYRTDRKRPTVVREYMEECFNERSPVWKKSPRRMLRHRSLIQCGRVAFGFGGGIGVAGDEDLVDVTPAAVQAESKLVTNNDRAAALLAKPSTATKLAPVVETRAEPKPLPVEKPMRTAAQIDAEIAAEDARRESAATGYGDAP